MSMDKRQQVVSEALTWIDTPYHLNQCVKGAGVDCARFVHAVLTSCGLIQPEFIEVFGPDWSCHTKTEKYIFRMLRHAEQLLEGVSFASLKARPGSIVLVRSRANRVYDHGAIVISWPKCVHAAPPKVSMVDASKHWLWANRIVKIFEPGGYK